MDDTAQALSYFLLLSKQLKNGKKKRYNANKSISSYTKITNEQKIHFTKQLAKIAWSYNFPLRNKDKQNASWIQLTNPSESYTVNNTLV